MAHPHDQIFGGLSAPASLEVSATESFVAWLAQLGGSLAISTYQANKVVLLGFDGEKMTVLPRNFVKPMGMHVAGSRLALATRHDVVLFANAPVLAHEYLENQPGRYDSLWLPRVSYHTGDLNVHDLALGKSGVWLVNTRYGCLSHLSEEFNFVPVWKPPFLSALAPEDRCHLNGLAMIDGEPRYVTALGTTDAPGAWRENKASGGILMDVQTNQIVNHGLAMPHSPRWHRGQLWVLDSGRGELVQVNLADGKRTTVCSLAGYLRGLTFAGDFALVGLCQIREKHIFGGLPVQRRWPALRCGVALVDLRSGSEVGCFEFTAGATELFDVQVLPGTRRPMILNLERETARQAFTSPNLDYWLRPSNEIKS